MHDGLLPVDISNTVMVSEFRELLRWCWTMDPLNRPSAFLCSFGTLAMTDKVSGRTSTSELSTTIGGTTNAPPPLSYSPRPRSALVPFNDAVALHTMLGYDLVQGGARGQRPKASRSISQLRAVHDDAKRRMLGKQLNRAAFASWLGPRPTEPRSRSRKGPSGRSR